MALPPYQRGVRRPGAPLPQGLSGGSPPARRRAWRTGARSRTRVRRARTSLWAGRATGTAGAGRPRPARADPVTARPRPGEDDAPRLLPSGVEAVDLDDHVGLAVAASSASVDVRKTTDSPSQTMLTGNTRGRPPALTRADPRRSARRGASTPGPAAPAPRSDRPSPANLRHPARAGRPDPSGSLGSAERTAPRRPSVSVDDAAALGLDRGAVLDGAVGVGDEGKHDDVGVGQLLIESVQDCGRGRTTTARCHVSPVAAGRRHRRLELAVDVEVGLDPGPRPGQRRTG